MSKSKASSSPGTTGRGSNSSSLSSTNAPAAAAVGAGLTMPNRAITTTTTTTTATATATATTTSLSHQEQQCPPPATAAVMYPVASSGRGFLPCRPLPPYPFANPNPNPRPLPPPLPHPHPAHLPPSLKPLPPALHPIPKVAPSPSPSPSPHCETNGYKNVRDRNKDDSLVTVRDRKVRIIDGASVYSLCRSWVRNGFPDETQPQYGDVIKSLPQPLPITVTDSVPKDTVVEEEPEEKAKQEDELSVENLSAQDLLKRHVDQAKRVRSRLREERLRRIARYKTRLALLLPPLVEQFRSDAAAGN